jgi:hypothetical protein
MGELSNEDERNPPASESAGLPIQGDCPEKAGVPTRVLPATAHSPRPEVSRERLPDSKARPGRNRSTGAGAKLSRERVVTLPRDIRRESTVGYCAIVQFDLPGARHLFMPAAHGYR